jgi:nuclear pore complex protein Nup93
MAFRKHYVDNTEDDWERAKLDILNPAGRHGSLARLEAPADVAASASMHQSSAGAGSMSMHDMSHRTQLLPKTNLDAKRARYGAVVQELNSSRARRVSFGIVSQCMEAASSLPASSAAEEDDIIDAWDLLSEIVGETSGIPVSGRAQLTEGKFLRGNTQHHREELIGGVQRYCERLFEAWVTDQVEEHFRGAHTRAGSNPSLRSKIKSFVLMMMQNGDEIPLVEDTHDDVPIWPQVFFSIRCGDMKAAADIAKEAKTSPECAACLKHLASGATISMATKRLPDDMWRGLVHEYNQTVRNHTSDFYKTAVYNLVGKCEPNPVFNSHLVPTVEDWIWIKLSMLWSDPNDANELPEWLYKGVDQDQFRSKDAQADYLQQHSLVHLQQVVCQKREHFDADGKTPFVFFRVLIMTQQFEQAVSYLMSTDYSVEAVHFAIALNYYGLLSCTDESTQLQHFLSADRRLGLRLMLERYAKPFLTTEPEFVFHYYAVLGVPSPTGKLVLSEPLREQMVSLVLVSRDFTLLLGVVQRNQPSKSGVLYQFLDDPNDIVAVAANDARRNGNYQDAIRLLMFAEQLDAVADILVGRLGRLAAEPSNPERKDTCRIAEKLLESHIAAEPRVRRALTILLAFVRVFDLYHHDKPSRWLESMRKLEETELVPSDRSIHADMQTKVDMFKNLNESVRRAFRKVAIVYMEMLYYQFQEIKRQLQAAAQRDSSRTKMLQVIRNKGEALVQFVGMLQLTDVHAQLVRFAPRMR